MRLPPLRVGMAPPPKEPAETPGSGAPAAAEIAPGIFVGGWAEALTFDGTRICVLDEAPGTELPAEVHVPIYDPVEGRPIRANLDRVVALATEFRRRGDRVLFFCGHGQRRGPLAGAWFLHVVEGLDLDAAYRRIRAVRPRAESYRTWLPDASPLVPR